MSTFSMNSADTAFHHSLSPVGNDAVVGHFGTIPHVVSLLVCSNTSKLGRASSLSHDEKACAFGTYERMMEVLNVGRRRQILRSHHNASRAFYQKSTPTGSTKCWKRLVHRVGGTHR